MSRKNANNRYNVWHHPDYNRPAAMAALNKSLETGEVVDFLNMDSSSICRKRRAADATNKEGNSVEDDDVATQPSLGSGDFYFYDEDSLFPLRLCKKSSIGKIMSNTASMPTLMPSINYPSRLDQKGGGLSHSFITSRTKEQRGFAHNRSLPGLISTQCKKTSIGQGTANATFDPNFDPTPWSSQNRVGPSPNIFAVSAQEMLTRDNTNTFAASAEGISCHASSNIFATGAEEMMNIFATSAQVVLTQVSSSAQASPPTLTSLCSNTGLCNYPSIATSEVSGTNRRQLLQRKMTRQENKELASFLGIFAMSLPPPNIGEDSVGGADPFALEFRRNDS
jgi:hypothetical protein